MRLTRTPRSPRHGYNKTCPSRRGLLSSCQRVTAMSFQRLYPPPAFVIITWYLPLDSNCTWGNGVSGLLKARTEVSAPGGAVCDSETIGDLRIECRGPRHTLLEQQHGCLEQGVRLESFLHRTVQKQIGQGEKAHAHMMRHKGPDHGARLSARQTGRGVIDRFIEAEFSFTSFRSEPLQIQARLLGRHHQRKRRGIWRNDQIVGEPAFESQAGYAEGAVLVVEMGVDRVVAGFRNAPRLRRASSHTRSAWPPPPCRSHRAACAHTSASPAAA